MKIMRQVYGLVFILFGTGIDCFPQFSIPQADFFTVQNGLSQSQVNSVIQDSYGFLWIGTQDGLNRYDGIQFWHYHNIPFDSTSLSNNYIRQISEDNSGNLWLATDNGLSEYNRETGSFVRYLSGNVKNKALSGNEKFFAVFASPSGKVWVKSNDAILEVDKQTHKVLAFEHYFNPTHFVSLEHYAIFEDRQGNVWVGTKDGLNLFDKSHGAFRRFGHNPSDPGSISDDFIKAIFQDHKGRLWIGTGNGLNLLNPEKMEFSAIYPGSYSGGHPVFNSVNAIAEDREGNLWLGTDEGIAVYNPETHSCRQILQVSTSTQILTLTSVTSLAFDQSGIMWVGALEGLYKIDTKPKKFKLYKNSLEGMPGFSSDLFSSVWQDPRGLLWLGTWGDGLNLYDRNSDKVIHYSKNNSDPTHRISNDFVFAILGLRNGEIMLGTQNGLDVQEPGMKSFRPLCELYPDLRCSMFRNNRIYRLLEDTKGNVWIATAFGLHRFSSKQDSIASIFRVKHHDRYYDLNTVYSLAEDPHGNIWFGTDNGLYMYSPETGLYDRYEQSENPSDSSLTSNSVYCLFIDSRNILWAGTASGLNWLNPQTGHFSYYTIRDGLPNNFINSIQEDNGGNIWISTNIGLAKLDRKTQHFFTFDLSDGLQNYEYNINCSCRGINGELFFGGLTGLNAFTNDSIRMNETVPPVRITSIEMYENGKVKEVYYSIKREINIPWKIRNFVIEYAALDFTYPVRNRYEYQLTEEGETGVWIDTKGRTSTSFIDLSPGTYIFRVRGSNSDNVWNEEGTSLRIIVHAPYWRSKTALLIYLIAGIFSIFLFIQLRTYSLRKANRELAEKQIAALRIEKQREELAIKNKNITDSLNYAKRIQEALMPSEKTFKRLLPESFILYKPKDIVSGDFYWVTEKEGMIGIAAVDCTGHGVPGAFMSIIGFELFRKIVNHMDLRDPSMILGMINEQFAAIFKDVENMSLKDGMDLAFCTIDTKRKKLIFAGAINPLYLIRDNRVIEIKGDRFSVGLDENERKARGFTVTETDLEEEDIVYIFSDGYADQFGGEEGKKFKYRRFRFLLLNIHRMVMERQKIALEEAFDSWRGTYDQVDDILVIGFKPMKHC